jgi:hypothetical protein
MPPSGFPHPRDMLSVQASLTADFHKLDLYLVTLPVDLNFAIGVKSSGSSLKDLGRKVKCGQILAFLVLEFG